MRIVEGGMRNLRIQTRFYIILSLVTAIGYLWPDKADAIPYFSRKYNTPCTMCHVQFPRLNPTGMTFKQNGYRLKGEEGDYVWQDKLFPISGMVTFNYKIVNRKGSGWSGEEGSQSLFRLDEMEFFSAGALAPRISYYLSFGSGEEMDFAPGVAFVIFNDLVPESRANIRVGKFYNEFFYLADKRRFSIEPYTAPVTRTQYGLELNGEYSSTGIRYAFGVANDEMTEDKPGETATKSFKDVSNDVSAYYGWSAYSIAGQTIGIRGYTSKAGAGFGVKENHTQFDTNLSLQFDPVTLTLAYYTQSNVDGVKGLNQVNLLTELTIAAGPQLICNLRHELQDKDTFARKDNKYIFNTNYYIAPNIGLIGEYVKQEGKGSQKDEDKLQLGIQLVF